MVILSMQTNLKSRTCTQSRIRNPILSSLLTDELRDRSLSITWGVGGVWGDHLIFRRTEGAISRI